MPSRPGARRVPVASLSHPLAPALTEQVPPKPSPPTPAWPKTWEGCAPSRPRPRLPPKKSKNLCQIPPPTGEYISRKPENGLLPKRTEYEFDRQNPRGCGIPPSLRGWNARGRPVLGGATSSRPHQGCAKGRASKQRTQFCRRMPVRAVGGGERRKETTISKGRNMKDKTPEIIEKNSPVQRSNME